MNGWLCLVALVATGIAIRAFYWLSPRHRTTGHCWHSDHFSGYDGMVTLVKCCYCGLEFDALDKIGAPGHGPHSPKNWYPNPPQEDCPKRHELTLNEVG